LSSNEADARPRRRLIGVLSTAGLLLIAFCWLTIGIYAYNEPIDQTRVVWKPGPGKVVYKVDFPAGTTERQVAGLAREDFVPLNFRYVLDHTLVAFGEETGALGRIVTLTYGVNVPTPTDRVR
jgi:hypothetical protein